MTDYSERIAGMLVGHLVGDAMGSGYEFGQPFQGSVPFRQGVFGHAPGCGTDDTAVMRACARAVVATTAGQPYDVHEYVAALIEWYDSGPLDVGGQTARAIRHWVASGVGPPAAPGAQGNGSLMGCAPLAVLPTTERYPAALAHAWATHPSSANREAVEDYTDALASLLGTEAPFGDTVADIFTDLARPEVDGKSWSPSGPQMGWVVGSAYLAFQALADSVAVGPTEALRNIVRLGGDTDTNAAIAGAMLGARYGIDAWREVLDDLEPTELNANLELAGALATR